MAFLKNTWYVAAWSSELSQTKLLGRQIIGERLVFYRDNNNEAIALTDRCSHRFAPLSMGKLKGDCIECPYHGLQFGSDGTCVHNPHGDGRIPPRAHIRAFPVAEKFNAVWVWLGDPDQANPDLIPNFDFMIDTTHYIGEGSLKVSANYLLEVDNIMDLSHIEFVHPLFASPAVSAGEVTHEVDGDTVWSRRDMPNDSSPPEFIREVFNIPEGDVDRWLHVHWKAPAYMALYAGGVASGTPREQGIESQQVHWFTPETEQSTHYFYAISVPKAAGEWGEQFVTEEVDKLNAPFKYEDLPILEAQYENIDRQDIMDLKPMILDVDAAGHTARQILARKIAEEESV